MPIGKSLGGRRTVRNMVRSVYADATGQLDGFRRRRLAIPTSDVPAATDGSVYFLVGDYERPAGGIRVVYRHVDILNAAGVRASVLHRSRGFRCTWFENRTKVTDTRTVAITPSDLLVVSELDVDLVAALPSGFPHVIFNQGVHLTWRREADRVTGHYRGSPDLCRIVSASAHSADFLRYAFPSTPVSRIHLGIDPDLFRYGEAERPQRIAYMPRRGKDDATTVLTILAARNVLLGWEVVPLDNLSHSEVGNALRQSRIFLSFADQEGFGLPSAEAMACGAYVIGYDGFGGREYFLRKFSQPVRTADVLGMAKAIESTLTKERDDPCWCRRLGHDASRFIHSTYSPEREAREVISIYSALRPPERNVQHLEPEAKET